jgi:hypothetical protein
LAFKSSNGASDEHELARFVKRSNQITGSKTPVVAEVVAAEELLVNDTNLFLDLEKKAVAGLLRIEEIPVSLPRFGMLGEENLSPPPVLIVPSTRRMPVLIADVAPRLAAEARPKRQGSAAAGFSDDDLALPSPAKTDTENSVSEADAPPLVATKPSVNQQGAKSLPSPSKAVPPTSATLDVTPQLAATDLDPDIVPVPSLARSRSRIKDPIKDPKTATVQNQTSSTGPNQVTIVPDSDPISMTPKVAPKQILRAEPPIRITRQLAAFRSRIDSVLRFYYDRPLNTKDDSAWSIMHSILGYGVNAPLAVGGEHGRRTNAVGWMCRNNPCAGRRLLYLDDGYVTGREGPGFQGHPGQFLAMLAQVRLAQDYPIRVGGKQLSVKDLIEAEKRTCGTDKELTFKLIGLSHYLESDAEWLNEHGEIWTIPKMLQIEMAQPVNGAACGGTHRVMACCYAVLKREQRGEPLFGPYLAAKKYMRKYQRYAMTLQTRDGSFSSDWFKRRTERGDMDRKLQTTGHILEWLVFTLPRNELSNPRVVRATQYLTNVMIKHRYHEWEVGPRGHALRALALFRQRVFPSPPPLAQINARQVK